MTHRIFRTTLISLVILFLGVRFAAADEIRLVNGDRITGEIVKMEDEVISVKTTYAGEIQVKREEVACIVSDKELAYVLKTKELLIGRAVCVAGGKIQILSEKVGKSTEISLSELESIYLSPPSGIKYKAHITAGGTITSGNTDTQTAYASAGFESRSKRHRFTLGAKYNYDETDDELTARNAFGSIKYDLFITNKIYSYAHALFERDDFQDLNLRSALGLGLGYQFLDSKRTSLFGEAGVSYFNEDFDVAEDEHFASLRWSVGFNFEILPDRIKFFHLHEGYYSLEESNSYYIRTEQGFRLSLVRSLFANFQVDYKYNSQPAPGNRKYDTLYIFGLGYEYNF